MQAERFDFVTFDRTDTMIARGSLDEGKRPATLQSVGNQRSTPGLFGAGYLEMLARQIAHESAAHGRLDCARSIEAIDIESGHGQQKVCRLADYRPIPRSDQEVFAVPAKNLLDSRPGVN